MQARLLDHASRRPDPDGPALPRWALELYREGRKRAAKRGVEFGLTTRDMEAIMRRSGGRCEITGLAFSGEKTPGAFRRPFIPSLDRVDSKRGYLRGNVRLVCYCVNAAMNEWGEVVFTRMMDAIRQRRPEQAALWDLDAAAAGFAPVEERREDAEAAAQWHRLRSGWMMLGDLPLIFERDRKTEAMAAIRAMLLPRAQWRRRRAGLPPSRWVNVGHALVAIKAAGGRLSSPFERSWKPLVEPGLPGVPAAPP